MRSPSVVSSDEHLYVLDRSDGSEVTRLAVGEPVRTSPAVVGDWLCFGAHDGKVHAYRVG